MGCEEMIRQPKRNSLNTNASLCQSEIKRICSLNERFFNDIDLTAQENTFLIWLCGWDNWTFDALISVLEKVKEG